MMPYLIKKFFKFSKTFSVAGFELNEIAEKVFRYSILNSYSLPYQVKHNPSFSLCISITMTRK